jgi:hypothetical protein
MVVTFRQWLKDKELHELALTPLQIRQIMGNATAATNPSDVNQVAKGIIRTSGDKQLVGALAIDPLLRQIGDKLMAGSAMQTQKKGANAINTNTVGNSINQASMAGSGPGGLGGAL